MELLIVRHGLPEHVDLGDDGGAADPGLSPTGREQAEALAGWLAAEPPEAIYASPMRRAVETAAPLAAATGVEVVTRDALVEYDSGSSYYVPIEDLDPAHPRFAQVVEDWIGPSKEAERAAFRARVAAAIDAIAADHPGQRVAVVCHGGVINVYLAEVLGMSASLFFKPDYTGVSRIRVGRDGSRMLVSVNECGHLHAAG